MSNDLDNVSEISRGSWVVILVTESCGWRWRGRADRPSQPRALFDVMNGGELILYTHKHIFFKWPCQT